MKFKKIIKKLLLSISNHKTDRIIKRKKYYIKFFGRCYTKISKKANIISNGMVKFNNSIYSKNQNYEKGIFVVRDDAKVIMESGSEFRSGCKFFVFKGASFSIGRNSFININSFVECREQISIGNNTLISRNVTIIDGDTHIINGKKSQKPIFIGDNVLIGTNSIILKGVTIGNGSIIGAGSVVTHDIPSGCMAAGNPAVIIKEGVSWKR